ncbi:hypothetical protein [Pyxidicoccus xibeiensis]|uniref:hypothetical protein n=1 Tax=Pyxidicoccus xibeiensis TaxID=2906759 RepID=UPI0020A7B183|nr:hypothetical protein [Pyxidicoccus xibeiensis]MCP3143025.1 hypothetical protein [Pyxidicoccus xibeiensis]
MFEPVLLVSGYHDGPVAGVARYAGRAVVFDFLFDDEGDRYSDRCVLRFVSDGYVRLGLERREQFKQWWAVHGRKWPAAAAMSRWEAEPDTQRLNAAMKACLDEAPAEEVRVRAVVRRRPGQSAQQGGINGEYEISWGEAW